MKWTAIDLGQAEIKTAVCNASSNKPERLVYNEGLSYSYMPHGVVVSNDEVYIGHQVLLLAAMGVDGVVSKINENFKEKNLKKALFNDKECFRRTLCGQYGWRSSVV